MSVAVKTMNLNNSFEKLAVKDGRKMGNTGMGCEVKGRNLGFTFYDLKCI